MSAARTVAIIVAGGTGSRFGRDGGKQLLRVAGRPVAAWAIGACAAARTVSSLVVVCHPDRVEEYEAALAPGDDLKPIEFVAGGETRQDSVVRGLAAALAHGAEVVAVHDGARPLVSPDTVDSAVAMLLADEDLAGVVVGHPATDTIKIASAQREVSSTPDRATLWSVQTPQVFRARALDEALSRARADGFVGTDDSSAVERLGARVALLEGPRDNIKITVPEDAVIAEAILSSRKRGERS